MEGKGIRAAIVGLLILGLVVAQIEAKSCCRTTTGRNCYNTCRFTGASRPTCANLCDCIIISGSTCPSSHPRSNMLENFGAVANEYCKLGCASSVCETLSTTNEQGEGEVNKAVKHCVDVCSELCNGAKTSALATASA